MEIEIVNKEIHSVQVSLNLELKNRSDQYGLATTLNSVFGLLSIEADITS